MNYIFPSRTDMKRRLVGSNVIEYVEVRKSLLLFSSLGSRWKVKQCVTARFNFFCTSGGIELARSVVLSPGIPSYWLKHLRGRH